jgi:hypothetical protein
LRTEKSCACSHRNKHNVNTEKHPFVQSIVRVLYALAILIARSCRTPPEPWLCVEPPDVAHGKKTEQKDAFQCLRCAYSGGSKRRIFLSASKYMASDCPRNHGDKEMSSGLVWLEKQVLYQVWDMARRDK